MKDIILHTILIIILSFIINFLFVISAGSSHIIFFWALSSFMMYWREVTQYQSKEFNNNFEKGWLLNKHHNKEWLFPSIFSYFIIIIISIIINLVTM